VKPYHRVTIAECGEALIPIPGDCLALIAPHPYEALGAPYGSKSPFYLREGVLAALLKAQEALQQEHPSWQIQVFDAYRPIAVQQFMVDYTFQALLQTRGLSPEALTTLERQAILEQVYEFWAVPSPNPATPPPHSTGAAVDVTLLDELGQPVAMGSAIDELSPRSYPNHFEASMDHQAQVYHQHRQCLCDCMTAAGFTRHPKEWWHFSLGDQMWAWLRNQSELEAGAIASALTGQTACYGGMS